MAKILWHHFRFEASALAVERKRTFLKERRCIVGGNSVAKKASGKTESQCVRKGLHPMDLSLSRSLSVSLSLSVTRSLSACSLSLSLLSSRLLFFSWRFSRCRRVWRCPRCRCMGRCLRCRTIKKMSIYSVLPIYRGSNASSEKEKNLGE